MEQFLTVFSYLCKMSAAVLFVIPVVLLARIILGRVSKKLCYILWSVVAVRLCCPILLPAEFGLFHYVDVAESRLLEYADPITSTVDHTAAVAMDSISGSHRAGNDRAAHAAFGMGQAGGLKEKNASPAQIQWYHYIYLAGLFMMLSHTLFACLFLKRKLSSATLLMQGVFESETVDSPFVFGVRNPVIYLPYRLSEQELEWILQHEQCHVRRKDHLIKWFAWALLCVYWFHPIVWISWVLMNRDMEMSCDEYVLRGADLESRKKYSRVLLGFSCRRRDLLYAGLGFGERSVKSRMRYILTYKKRNILSAIAAVLFLIAVAVFCLTDNKTMQQPNLGGEDARETVSEAANALYEASNPYIGDASANGRLLGVIGTYLGGFDQMFTTELQTSQEPYVMTLHFKEKPDEQMVWRNAVLFLALTENCGEVHWDYRDEGKLFTDYVSFVDVCTLFKIDNLKDYAASPERVEELLAMISKTENIKRLTGDLPPGTSEE